MNDDEVDDYDKQFDNIDAEFTMPPWVDNDKEIWLQRIRELEEEIEDLHYVIERLSSENELFRKTIGVIQICCYLLKNDKINW